MAVAGLPVAVNAEGEVGGERGGQVGGGQDRWLCGQRLDGAARVGGRVFSPVAGPVPAQPQRQVTEMEVVVTRAAFQPVGRREVVAAATFGPQCGNGLRSADEGKAQRARLMVLYSPFEPKGGRGVPAAALLSAGEWQCRGGGHREQPDAGQPARRPRTPSRWVGSSIESRANLCHGPVSVRSSRDNMGRGVHVHQRTPAADPSLPRSISSLNPARNTRRCRAFAESAGRRGSGRGGGRPARPPGPCTPCGRALPASRSAPRPRAHPRPT